MPSLRKKLPKIGKKREKIRKRREKIRKKREKEEKSGRKGKNREGFFTLPLLTDRSGYATGSHIGLRDPEIGLRLSMSPV